jgi:hypothetical protein
MSFWAPTMRADTLLSLSSDLGDPIGRGITHLYGPSDGTFSMTSGARGEVRVSFSGGGTSWSLTFAPPPNATLAGATYENAMRFPFQNPYAPGLDVTGGGTGCNKITGRFEVRQVSRDANGSVTAFWATFEQHCEAATPALRGEVRWNADTSLYVSSPALVFVYPTRAVQIPVGATDAATGPVHLSCTSPPSGSMFIDNGNGTGVLSWPAGSPTAMSFTIPFTASDDLGHTATSITTLHVFWPDIFRFSAPPASSFVSAPTDRSFDLRVVNGTIVRLGYSTQGHSWNWSFGGAFTPKLEPGVFIYGTVFSLPDLYPFVRTSFDQNGCSTSTGTCHVRQVAYDGGGQATSFWATFDQLCGSGHQLGEVRINADTSLYFTAPGNVFVTPGQATSFELSATDVASRPVTLSSTGLPAGAQVVSTGFNSWRFDWPSGGSTVGDRTVRFQGLDDRGASARVTTTVRVHSPDLFRLQSEPGDPVGLGSSLQFTPADGPFLTSVPGSEVNVAFQGSGHWWTASGAAPSGRPLTPGIYDQAARYALQAPDQAGIEVLGDDRRCDQLTGTWQIRRIEQSGGSLSSYWATFEQRCVGSAAALRAEVRFNTDTSLYVGSFADVSALTGVPLEIAIAGADLRGRPLQLSAPDAPSGTLFTDHGDGTGTLLWQTPSPGDHDVPIRFVARSSVSDSASSNTLVHVGQAPLLTLTSPPGDPIGQGQTRQFGPDNGGFDGTVNPDSSVTIQVTGGGHSYSLTFAAAGGHLPRVGRYGPVFLQRGTPPTGPWLDIQGDGRACSTAYGSFTIRELRITDGLLQGFWATFSQECEGQPALTGEIRFAIDGVVSTLVSNVESDFVDGRVRLRWYSTAPQFGRATLQRQVGDEPWVDFATLNRDGYDMLSFEDSSVQPGGTYGYRLETVIDGELSALGEVWVTVPSLSPGIHVRGSNPTGWPLEVEFFVPGDGTVLLQLVDIAGRVRASHRLNRLGVGSQRFVFSPSDNPRSGVYFIRLLAGDTRLMSRVVILE